MTLDINLEQLKRGKNTIDTVTLNWTSTILDCTTTRPDVRIKEAFVEHWEYTKEYFNA